MKLARFTLTLVLACILGVLLAIYMYPPPNDCFIGENCSSESLK